MSSKEFTLSIPEHTLRLDGYMDAVGRVLSTESELVALCAQVITDDAHLERLLNGSVNERTLIENWSHEFGAVVDELLRLDQRSKLGFYLVDYINWLNYFTADAKCFRLKCGPLGQSIVDQAAYLLELEKSHRVLLIILRSARTDEDNSAA